MKKKKIYKKQVEGLFLISKGMLVQLNLLKRRHKQEKDDTYDIAIKALEYWLNEVNLALKGEKHF